MYSFTCGGYNLVLSFDKDEGSFNFKTSDKRGKYEGSSYLKPLGCGGMEEVVGYLNKNKEKLSIEFMGNNLVINIKFFGQKIVINLAFYEYTYKEVIDILKNKIQDMDQQISFLKNELNIKLEEEEKSNNYIRVSELNINNLPNIKITQTLPYITFSDENIKKEFLYLIRYKNLDYSTNRYMGNHATFSQTFKKCQDYINSLECKDDDTYISKFIYEFDKEVNSWKYGGGRHNKTFGERLSDCSNAYNTYTQLSFVIHLLRFINYYNYKYESTYDIYLEHHNDKEHIIYSFFPLMKNNIY